MAKRSPVLVLGEALVDVVHANGEINEHVGGSPANVAFGLGRLEHDVTLAAWFAKDERGERIAQACRDAGVSIEAHLFPQGGHGLSLDTVDTARAGSPGEGDLNNVVPAVQIWPRLAFDWLRRTFDAR